MKTAIEIISGRSPRRQSAWGQSMVDIMKDIPAWAAVSAKRTMRRAEKARWASTFRKRRSRTWFKGYDIERRKGIML